MCQICSIDKCEHFFDALGAKIAIQTGETIANIGFHTHMRKERRLLGDQRGISMTWLSMNTAYGITQGTAVEGDAAEIREIETSKKTKKRALAGARRPKNHCPL